MNESDLSGKEYVTAAEIQALRQLLALAPPQPWTNRHPADTRVHTDRSAVVRTPDGLLVAECWGYPDEVVTAELVVAAVNALPHLLDLAEGAAQ